MLRHPNVRRPLAALALGVTAGGCFSWRVETAPTPNVVAGAGGLTLVRVTTRDTRTVDRWHVRITGDTLYGVRCNSCDIADRAVAVPVNDIESLSTSHFDAGRTILLVVGIAALPFIVAFVAIELNGGKVM